jgi:hypothetical protein
MQKSGLLSAQLPLFEASTNECSNVPGVANDGPPMAGRCFAIQFWERTK